MSRSKVRAAHVAGQFYPEERSSLLDFLEKSVPKDNEKTDALAVLMPHAGYIYSGETAALTISRVQLKETVLILGPNHTGLGRPFSLMCQGAWETPLGNVGIDEVLARDLLEACPRLEEDEEAHRYEHAIEVELPFLQYLSSDIKFVPITVGTADLDLAGKVGEGLGKFLRGTEKPVLLLTSSDLNHYENDRVTQRKDQMAIDAILSLDPDRLARTIEKHDISMCGFVPAYMMLAALRVLGVRKGELVDHRTSAWASRDYSRVVGYAGIIFTR